MFSRRQHDQTDGEDNLKQVGHPKYDWVYRWDANQDRKASRGQGGVSWLKTSPCNQCAGNVTIMGPAGRPRGAGGPGVQGA